MFLTPEKFMEYFPSQPIISREQFVNTLVVTYKGSGNPRLVDLFEQRCPRVIKSPEDYRIINKESIINYLYDIAVVNRDKYLLEFYNRYYVFPNPYGLVWTDTCNIHTPGTVKSTTYDQIEKVRTLYNSDDSEGAYKLMINELNKLIEMPIGVLSTQKNDASRYMIRNLHYIDILHTTRITNSVKCDVSFWQTFINLFNKLVLEDRFFCKSVLELCLKKGDSNTFFYHIQQYQPKASILNPYTINWILKNVFTGTKLFTPVLSWSSYLMAFMHSDWEEYVGVDVIQEVCDRTKFMFDYYQSLHQTPQNNKTIDLFCCPSESLYHNDKFLDKYRNHFDAILMCPPYYDMEIYEGGQQSIKSFKTYAEWLTGYWEYTVAVNEIVLKKGGRFGFIVNDYESLKKVMYPLINDLNLVSLKYFKLVDAFRLINRGSPLRVNYKDRTEMLFVYEKI